MWRAQGSPLWSSACSGYSVLSHSSCNSCPSLHASWICADGDCPVTVQGNAHRCRQSGPVWQPHPKLLIHALGMPLLDMLFHCPSALPCSRTPQTHCQSQNISASLRASPWGCPAGCLWSPITQCPSPWVAGSCSPQLHDAGET